ncbi:MAG: 3-hydroxyacyl-ACP dehydratase FabZ [Thermodesulfobacteriota bacterium]
MDIKEIMSLLPHRYPFLLVDRITEFEENKRIVGIKNVTINEPFFQGHFPEYPIMPGVLIVEAMAQVGGLLAFKSSDEEGQKIVYFVGIDKARFRSPVTPGDQLRFVVELLRTKKSIWVFKGEAFVDEKLVAEAELMATIMDR